MTPVDYDDGDDDDVFNAQSMLKLLTVKMQMYSQFMTATAKKALSAFFSFWPLLFHLLSVLLFFR